MADLTCKRQRQDFFCRNYSSQRTCIGNSAILTLTQPKIQALKILAVWAHCTNEYVKEKENTTTSAIHQGAFLVTMGNYLWNNILL